MLTDTVNISIFQDTILEFDEEFVVFFNTTADSFGVTFSVMSSSTTIVIQDDGNQD